MILENIPKMVGIIYAVIALLFLIYLFYIDRFSKKISYFFLTLSTVMGFLIFAPMFPVQLQLILLGETVMVGAPIGIALLGLVLFVVLTLLFGRMFCGYLCPIGAIQELLYILPTPKKRIAIKKEFMVFRIIFFIGLFVLAIFFSINLLSNFGITAFFNLDFTSLFSVVFVVIFIVSIFVYRVFCRLFCPYAVFLSLASQFSFFKFSRNENCIDCKKCEEICPTNEAHADDLKQECYLCYRCKDVCPVDAIDYKKNEKEGEKI